MKEINYIHKKRPLQVEIFPYKIKIFTIEKNKKFQYPDGKFDVFCCMNVEYTNLLEVRQINTNVHSTSGPLLIDTKGHQYPNDSWPRLDEFMTDENEELIYHWAIDDGKSRFLFPLVDGEIWGGVSTRGWVLWPKIAEDAKIKRIILTLDVIETKDKPVEHALKDLPGITIVQHIPINIIY